MGKVMRSVVALLLVLVCASSVAFAVVADDGDFPEPLIGEEVEATDLIEKIEITSENRVKLRANNDTSKVEGVINLSDMAYVVLDDSHSVIDDRLSYSRATTSVSWSVKANLLKKLILRSLWKLVSVSPSIALILQDGPMLILG